MLETWIGAVLLAAPGAAGQTVTAEGFTFTIPPGWMDVTSRVDPAALPGVSSEMLAAIRRENFVVYAMDSGGTSDGFAENLNVIVRPGSPVVTQRAVEERARVVPGEYAKSGVKCTVLEATVVDVGGAPAALLVMEGEVASIRTKVMEFVLAGSGNRFAIMTYTAAPETFAAYRPIFMASAQATKGGIAAAAPASGRSSLAYSLGRIAGIGAVVALFLAYRHKRADQARRAQSLFDRS